MSDGPGRLVSRRRSCGTRCSRTLSWETCGKVETLPFAVRCSLCAVLCVLGVARKGKEFRSIQLLLMVRVSPRGANGGSPLSTNNAVKYFAPVETSPCSVLLYIFYSNAT